MGEHFGEYVFAGFDKTRIGFDRASRLTGGITLTEVEAQALDDLPRVRCQQNQVGGEEYGFFDVVGNQEHRLGGALPDLQQQLLHLLAGEGVEGAEGFVHQQHARVGSERAGQADTLLLAARELPDAALFKTAKIDQCEHFPGASFAFVPGNTGQLQAEADVGQHVLPGQQRVVLEHHAALGARAFDRHAVEGDAPGAGFDETGNQVQQRSLATAGRAEGDQQLPGPQAQGDIRQHRFRVAGVLCADALQL
ncbi:hypothetical protein D3C81_1053890 [compost metagenome]